MNRLTEFCTCLVTGIAAAVVALPANGQPSSGRDPKSQDERRTMEVVELPAPSVSITVEGEYRVIRANGLPNHATGEFPNDGNPNAMRPQNHEYRVPLHPKIADRLTPARPEFGIALNGVVFDSGTGEFWSADGRRHGPGRPGPPGKSDRRGGRPGPPGRGGPGGGPGAAWNYEALGGGVPFGIDRNHAHVQPTGKYHYHGIPTGLLESLGQHSHEDGQAHAHKMLQIGWAFDGFPIYAPYGYADPNDPDSELVELKSSYRLKAGRRPSPPEGPGEKYDGTFNKDWEYVNGLGDLDECNGRFGITPEFPEGTYHYFITSSHPAVPRLWRGVPAARSRRGPGGPGGFGSPPPRR